LIYPHQITLYKAILTESATGGTSYSYSANGTVHLAFVQPQRESLSIVNELGGRDMVVDAYCEPSTPAEAKDRFIFSDDTFEITGAIRQYGQTGTHHIKVTARILDQIE
jgi:hypothetical protein